jgi:aryl-alcohol dehydrogenase-like predicted oxidoreductase
MNIGIIVRVPLDEGGLTGRITPETEFPAGDWRQRYFGGDRKKQVFDRVNAMESLLGVEAATIPELALRFTLHPAAVSTVIPGMRAVANVETNCGYSDGRVLTPQTIAKLRAHAWERNFYGE